MSDTEKNDPVEQADVAWPLADKNLQEDLVDLLNICTHRRQLKKGANEVTKAVNRGIAEIVVLAADTAPIQILLHLPLLCEDKSTTYVWISSKIALGRAVGVSRKVISAAITSNESSDLNGKINEMKDRIEKLAL